jgi:hypothetical protein
MAHFVKIVNSIIVDGMVINNEVVGEYPQSDIIGQQFIASLGIDGNWKQTSYNNNFRKQYAGIGMTYDSIRDEFVSMQPYPSWSLDSNNDWQAPTPKPEGNFYWDEESLSWLAIPVG